MNTKRKLKLWGISPEDSGVQLFRINQPLRFIGNQKLAKVHTLPFYGQHANHLTSKEFIDYYALEGKWADVLYTTSASSQEYLALILALRDQFKLKLVVDIDDDKLSVITEPNNPAYRAYMDKSGRHAEYTQICLSEADLVTVSTDYLARKYASLNDNILVVKNAIDPKFYTGENKEDGLVIGYAGSGSHQADWKMIEPILLKLKKKYDFKVKLLGPMSADVDEQIKWVDMLKYPETLASMGFSIGLAPLKDSLMNRAKSNLRWLEYSSLSIPTIASDVVPFRGIKNIMLANEIEDWEASLIKLIEDETFRTELGRKAKIEMEANYNPYIESTKLYERIESLFV